jgi:hypothetical protein
MNWGNILFGFMLKLLIAIQIDFTVNIDKVAHPSSKLNLLKSFKLKSFTSKDFGNFFL